MVGTPTEYDVSFRIWHPTKPASEIIDRVGLEFDIVQSIGDQRQTRHGRKLEGVYSQTYLAAKLNEIEGEELDEFLMRMLVDTISGYSVALTEIVATGGRLEFFISVTLDGSGGVIIKPELSRQLAELDIELGLDLYELGFDLDTD